MHERASAARWRWIVGLVVVLAVAAGCSRVTGSKSSKSGRAPACAFVAKLDQIANTVASANVHNPDAFDKTLKAAVHEYVANLRSLRAVAPDELHAGLMRVEADVQQLRFDAALTDRAELDAYAARTCGRVASAVTTTSSPATGVTVPGSATTVAGETTTTATGSNG